MGASLWPTRFAVFTRPPVPNSLRDGQRSVPVHDINDCIRVAISMKGRSFNGGETTRFPPVQVISVHAVPYLSPRVQVALPPTLRQCPREGQGSKCKTKLKRGRSLRRWECAGQTALLKQRA
eukprot:1154560-Pelagomonas_calceolata.AAC.15